MMNKGHRHEYRIFKRFAVWLAVCLPALGLSQARADALPPPTPPAIVQTIANTPNGFPLSGGVTPDGRFAYSTGNPRPNTAQYESVRRAMNGTNPDLLSGLTGTKSHPITLRDNYGNAATGRISTATSVSSGVLDAAVKGYVIGDLAGRVVNSPNAHNAAQALANGNYGEAALSAAAALDVMNIGGGINSLMDTYRKAQDAKTADLVSQHQDAAKAYEQFKTLPEVYVVYWEPDGADGYSPGMQIKYIDSRYVVLSGGDILAHNQGKGYQLVGKYEIATPGGNWRARMLPNTADLYRRPVTPEELMLNQQEITQILLDQLHNNNSALNRNTQALTDLLNALVAGGHLDPSKQPTNVLGTPAENTFVTPPFTPAGSDQAQQTQFLINKDGSVTVSTINRPDLAANTSQAPTRAEVGQTAPSPAETRDAKQGSTAEKPDICAQNPSSLMCADLGNGDYTDPVLPNEQRGLNFEPADIFGSNGVCPQPKQVSVFNTTLRISYQPMCDFAAKIRLIVILLGISTALYMVYGAVNE